MQAPVPVPAVPSIDTSFNVNANVNDNGTREQEEGDDNDMDMNDAAESSRQQMHFLAASTKTDPDSWLLRLFESDFFDSRLAISYLYKYPKNVGIHHYICKELRKFHETEIRFLLPQICHIMISRPDESAALEEFITSLCHSSHHMAILTLWYLESYLNDMHNALSMQSESYSLCKRLYLACQAIVFSENTTSSQDLVSDLIQIDVQRSAHIPPTIVGVGLLLASLAAPVAYMAAEPLVSTQSRKPRFYNPMDDADSEFSQDESTPKENNFENQSQMDNRRKIWDKIFSRVPTASPSLYELSRGAAFSFKHFVEKTMNHTIRESASAIDVRLPSSSFADQIHQSSSADNLSPEAITDNLHNSLHRSHYFHSEMQFIMTLVDISERLVSVPRPARQSSLIAELSLLNHNLPACVCIPFWCPAVSANPTHHQVARIALSDCVVLNSADRVPFLILVEVIETTADDPGRGRRSLAHAFENSQSNFDLPKLEKLEIPSSPAKSNGPASHNSNQDSAEYHIKLLSRRQSVMKMVPPRPEPVAVASLNNSQEATYDDDIPEEESVDISLLKSLKKNLPAARLSPSSPKKEASQLSIPVSINSTEEGWEDEGPAVKIPIVADDDAVFADRMRTAAVLLAQLYQQQQKEVATLDTKTRSRSPSVASNSDLKSSTTPKSVSASVNKLTQMNRKSEFETIRNRVLHEMSASEDERMSFLNSSKGKKNIQSRRVDEILADLEETSVNQRDADDPSASVFREPWEVKRDRIRAESPYGHHKNWQLYSVIVKSGSDLRQEQLALQLITEMKHCWDAFKMPIWVYPFSILITSDRSGLIEVIPDSISIHSIKKSGYAQKLNQPGIAYTIYDHFVREFGQPGSNEFQQAQDNFLSSLAGYSIISYILQLKDRHNGNILLDRKGHITHIDFGFMLLNSPGSVGFELAPFKMPQEYIDILGGIGSEKFDDFRKLVKLGFLALRKRSETILSIVEIMEKDSRLPCFTGINKPSTSPESRKPNSGASPVTLALRDRLHLGLTDDGCSEFIDGLINSSCNNTFTALYDSFQFYANGIL